MGGSFWWFLLPHIYSSGLASPSAPKEEYLITDVAYCEQAVIFLKQAKLERDAGQRRKEDGTLPVSTDAFAGMTEFPLRIQTLLRLIRGSSAVIDMTASVRLKEPVAHNKGGIS